MSDKPYSSYDLPPKTTTDSAEATGVFAKPAKRGLTPIKLVGYTVSAVITITALSWCLSTSMSVLDTETTIDVNQASHRSGGPESREMQVRALVDKARDIDAELMRNRAERLRARNAPSRQTTQHVYEAWTRRIESLEKQIEGFERFPRGTIEYDIKRRIEELKADPAISEYKYRHLRD